MNGAFGCRPAVRCKHTVWREGKAWRCDNTYPCPAHMAMEKKTEPPSTGASISLLREWNELTRPTSWSPTSLIQRTIDFLEDHDEDA